MKRYTLSVICFVLAAMRSPAEYADSVWLDYQEGLENSGDAIMTDIQVEETSLYTFYAGLVWDTGYMGLQRGGSGIFKHVHFSIWDPPGGGFADLVRAGSEVVTQRFGGEGTGWKAMWPLTWKEGTTYRLCVRLTRTNQVTHYDSYFFDPEQGTWKYIATFRRRDALHSFSYVASFVEDFGSTLENRRSCLLGNAWLRTFDNNWIDLRTAKYATGGSKANKDADVVGEFFRLETGGSTTNDTTAQTTLTRRLATMTPDNHKLVIRPAGPDALVDLQWQTLPWRSYRLARTTNLPVWPEEHQHDVYSNRWSEEMDNNQMMFFQIISSE
jgi:hypothetical protein